MPRVRACKQMPGKECCKYVGEGTGSQVRIFRFLVFGRFCSLLRVDKVNVGNLHFSAIQLGCFYSLRPRGKSFFFLSKFSRNYCDTECSTWHLTLAYIFLLSDFMTRPRPRCMPTWNISVRAGDVHERSGARVCGARRLHFIFPSALASVSATFVRSRESFAAAGVRCGAGQVAPCWGKRRWLFVRRPQHVAPPASRFFAHVL